MTIFQRSRALGFGVLIITFAAGALSGAALERVLAAGEPPEMERRDERYDERRRYVIDRVDMSAEQRARIETILEERAERMRAVWREVEPRMDAITDSVRQEIMEVLTPAQQAEYESKLEQRRDKRRQDRGRSSSDSGDDGERRTRG